MAPELLRGEDCQLTVKTDVYALGMVTYEVNLTCFCLSDRTLTIRASAKLFSGHIPFEDKHHHYVLEVLIRRGERPSRPEQAELVDSIWDIIQRCWHEDHMRRPELEEVAQVMAANMPCGNQQCLVSTPLPSEPRSTCA
jgi:serine/threonine protein kinase